MRSDERQSQMKNVGTSKKPGLVMGRRWWAGPSIIDLVGRGPARSNNFSEDGPWPGPAHQIFRGWVAARTNSSHFQKFTARPDPARPIIFSQVSARPGPAHHMAARPMRHGLYMGQPDKYVGRPVDLTGRPMSRSTCCPAPKGACPYIR